MPKKQYTQTFFVSTFLTYKYKDKHKVWSFNHYKFACIAKHVNFCVTALLCDNIISKNTTQHH